MLAICAPRGQTYGIDLLNTFLEVAKKFVLDFTKLVSITTDGAPAMTGKKNQGFNALLYNYLKDLGSIVSSGTLPSFHCILHQESVCAQMAINLDLMNTVLSLKSSTT